MAKFEMVGLSVERVFDEKNAGLGGYDEDHVAAVAVRAFSRIADAWSLRNDDAAELVGASTRTWARMKKADWSGRLSQDQLMRISALVGLYKALHLYFSDRLADRWVCLPNNGPTYRGHAPLEVMKTGGLPAIMNVRNHVDALRGGL